MIHCLHGTAGSHHDWDLFKGKFGTEMSAMDLWSLLEQEQHLSLPAAGQRIADAADEGDILLGYSMGGRLALHALLADREKWKAAIIVAAHPGLQEGHDARILRDEGWAQLAEDDFDEFLFRWNEQELFDDSKDFCDGLIQAEQENKHQVARSFRDWSLGTQYDLRPAFPGIGCPVLWVTGAKDGKFSRIGEEASPKLPHGRHIYIPDAGHRVPWERPNLFEAAVKDFIDSVNISTCGA